MVRIVIAAVAVALTLAGCGSDKAKAPESSASSGASSSAAATSPAAATGDDEQQIRDLVSAQTDAFEAGDWDAMAEMTCSKYREQARNPGTYLVPPIGQFGTQEQVATLTVAQMSDALAQQFGTGVSKDTLNSVAQAIVAYDEPAYQAAMLDLVTEASSIKVDKVDNIKITGDTATADITNTTAVGTNPPQTKTDSTPYVREDGKWLDCSVPQGGS